jgi:hypothetical protein
LKARAVVSKHFSIDTTNGNRGYGEHGHHLSGFEESLADLIPRHYASEAVDQLVSSGACTLQSRRSAEEVVKQIIRTTVVHTIQQVTGRQKGSHDLC